MSGSFDKFKFAACVLGISLVPVTGLSLALSAKAIHNAGVFEERCARLLQENGEMRALLVSLPPIPASKSEIVISVAGSEYAPKTLALKNRNYLNLKSLSNGDRWKGQIGEDRFGHAIFESPAWSIRAGAIVLRTYEHKHGIKTVEALVRRFAEGNRGPYIKHLCKALGVKPDQKISFTKHLPELLKAMVYFETGQKLGREHLELVAALR